MNPPIIVETTLSFIKIAWDYPIDDGGCSLTGFIIQIDDGNGGDFSNDTTLEDKPYVRTFT